MVLARACAMVLRLLSICVLVLGCGPAVGGGDDGVDPIPSTLRVSLSAQRIDWADGVGATPAVTVMLIDADGNETDVTASATFEVNPVPLAGVSNALLVATGTMAGPGTVSAQAEGLVDDETFEVFVTQTVTGTANPSAPGLFAGATADPSQSLTIAYPPAGAMVPPNLGEMDVHWRDPAGKDLYEVTLSGGFVTLKSEYPGDLIKGFEVLFFLFYEVVKQFFFLFIVRFGLELRIQLDALLFYIHCKPVKIKLA